MQPHQWFIQKSYGYGAVPVTWQGWLWTLGTASIIAAAIGLGLVADLQHWPDRRSLQCLCALAVIVTCVVSFAVVRARTDGGFRWRL